MPWPRCRSSLSMTSASSGTAQRLRGIAASPGRVAGPIWQWPAEVSSHDPDHVPLLDGPQRLRRAIRQVQEQLSATTATLRQSGAGKQAGILDAQRLILDDPAFVDAAVASMA